MGIFSEVALTLLQAHRGYKKNPQNQKTTTKKSISLGKEQCSYLYLCVIARRMQEEVVLSWASVKEYAYNVITQPFLSGCFHIQKLARERLKIAMTWYYSRAANTAIPAVSLHTQMNPDISIVQHLP